MNVSPAIATSGKFSSRLPNSIQVLSVDWPPDWAATALLLVQLGQSGQPRPDDDTRTAAPVEMMTALAITEASAQPRSTRGVGRHTRPVILGSTRTMLLTLLSRPVGRRGCYRAGVGDSADRGDRGRARRRGHHA